MIHLGIAFRSNPFVQSWFLEVLPPMTMSFTVVVMEPPMVGGVL